TIHAANDSDSVIGFVAGNASASDAVGDTGAAGGGGTRGGPGGAGVRVVGVAAGTVAPAPEFRPARLARSSAIAQFRSRFAVARCLCSRRVSASSSIDIPDRALSRRRAS